MRPVWGWGETSERPDLGDLAARASAFFGALTPESAVPEEGLRIPAPRVPVPSALAPFSSAARDERAGHTWGKSYLDRLRGFRGDYSAAPDLVVHPRSEAEVVLTLECAERERLAVVPFGAGSTVTGGIEARLGPGHRGVLSLDLRGLSRVLEVDDVSEVARIQAGVLGPSLEAQLAQHGRTLRHFPQSFERSTLGGWIVTRAAGHFATVYTHIDALVESVRMVTPRGTWETRRLPASGAGPDAGRLVSGSEGILGVVTEAWMRVRRRPRFRAQASVRFDELSQAVLATRAIAQSGLFPTNCRLLDPKEAFLNAVAGDGSSVLVLGFESADHPVEQLLDCALALTAAHGGTCPKGKVIRTDGEKARAGDAGDDWRSSFLAGPWLQDGLIELGIIADTFETACTWTAFPALYGAVTEAVSQALERECGGGLVTCRFTHVYPDGPAPYFTWLGRARRGGEHEQWAAVKQAASDALERHGGTCTHHHAVGRMHRPHYDRERPPHFAEALRAVKRTVDPAGLLNPGVLIDP